MNFTFPSFSFLRASAFLRWFALLLLGGGAEALEVKETRWGFDGRVVAGRFNIFSVRLAQAGATPFDGEIVLRETRGGEQPVGAPFVQPLYLTPGTERWVQFTPFIPTENEWLLSWGRGAKDRLKIDPAKFAAPATVLLVDPGSPFVAESRLRAFPDDLFPTTIAATDALDMVALDHVPRWEAPRRDAFLDWVRRGGVVHLLRGASGFPSFDGELAPLNTALPRERFGAGMIVRHEVTRAECGAEFLKSASFPVRELETPTQLVIYGFDQSILRGLAAMTRPEVAWWLIYLLTLGYLGIIGPLHYRWSKRFDYRISLGVLGGTVLAFALAFFVAGKRGAGEQQITHSLSIARALGGGRYDVTQWLSAFAVKGDTYKLTHAAPANIYSASSDLENVNGRIFSGREGHFLVDLPLYSSRPFLHRGVMSSADLSVGIGEWVGNHIELQTGETFPDGVTEMWARSVFGFIRFHKDGNRWVWDRTAFSPQTEKEMFQPNLLGAVNNAPLGEKMFAWQALVRPLIAHTLGGVEGMQHHAIWRPLPADQLQLFIYAPVPAGFRLQGKGFGRENGWVLYVQDVFKPAS